MSKPVIELTCEDFKPRFTTIRIPMPEDILRIWPTWDQARLAADQRGEKITKTWFEDDMMCILVVSSLSARLSPITAG